MTKSRAEELAEELTVKELKGVPESEWRNGCENGYKSGFLAGMKAMLAEAEIMAYVTFEDKNNYVKIKDLKKLMGEK